MDKYEFNIKVEQIKKLVSKSDFETAMKIADTIDWRRVRNANLLSMIAQIYEKNEEYQEAKDILLMAFERAPIGKRLLFKLTELAIKEGSLSEAEVYYREFCELATEDPRQHLLRYMILKEKGATTEQLINALERYVNEELEEQWMYELACLYSQSGMPEKCVQICDQAILMFGVGKYVDRALELKKQYAPLTNYQMDLVENRHKYEAKLKAVEENYDNNSPMAVPYDDPVEEDYPEDYRRGDYAQEEDYGQNSFAEEGYIQEESIEEEEIYPQEVRVQARYVGGRQRRAKETEPAYQSSDIDNEAELAKLREAEAEERLAAEMSKISIEPYIDEEDPCDKTRILEDIRNIKAFPIVAAADAASLAASEVAAGAVRAQGAAVKVVQKSARTTSETAHAAGEAVREAYRNGRFTGDRVSDTHEREDIQSSMKPDTRQSVTLRISPDDEDRPIFRELESEVPEAAAMADLEYEDEDIASLPENYHLMIEADNEEEGLGKALDALKKIHLELEIKNPVLKITGERLNKRGILASADKILGKDLIIEQAGDLTPESLDELDQLMEEDESGIIVVLIDDADRMEEIHQNHPSLASKFQYIGSCRGNDAAAEDAKAALARQMEAQEAKAREEALLQERARMQEEARIQEMARKQEEVRRREEARVLEQRKRQEARALEEARLKEEVHAREKARMHEEARIQETARAQKPNPPRQTKMVPPRSDFGVKPAHEPVLTSRDGRRMKAQVQETAEPVYEQDEEMDIEEFAQYACQYAGEIDCSISGKSMLALYERIEIMEEDGIPLTKEEAEVLIEEAADRAEKPSVGRFIKGVFSSKYDKDGLLILKEEHFINKRR